MALFAFLGVIIALSVPNGSGTIVECQTPQQPSHEVTPHCMTGLWDVCVAHVHHACNHGCLRRNLLRLRVMLVLSVPNDSGTIVECQTTQQPSHEVTPQSMTGLLHVCVAYVLHACNHGCLGRNLLRLRVMLVLNVPNDSGTIGLGRNLM
ncbi:hypothetical protein DFH28DRAFT_939931 [Melampsora americana]|nr:hypothetical protein DFH28DRAFT_939931 [Melampsora americana]